jgi:hypothetical protein
LKHTIGEFQREFQGDLFLKKYFSFFPLTTRISAGWAMGMVVRVIGY